VGISNVSDKLILLYERYISDNLTSFEGYYKARYPNVITEYVSFPK
jgi:hypothetical protein